MRRCSALHAALLAAGLVACGGGKGDRLPFHVDGTAHASVKLGAGNVVKYVAATFKRTCGPAVIDLHISCGDKP